ncbi:6635_t:CDS:2, partial [Rhizophagus irregularis]
MALAPSAETIVKIIISQGIQKTVRETVNKKIQFSTAMSVAKTGIQIAVSKNATAELIGILRSMPEIT